MINEVTFLNNSWIWQTVLIGILLWIIFIWKEFSQFGTLRFWTKSAIALLAVIALSMIALQPTIPIKKKGIKMALLTNGFKQNQLDSLKKVHKKLKIKRYENNHPIFDNSSISDSVFILGNGVASFDFWQLDSSYVNYLKGTIPIGIIKFKYDKQTTVGEPISFKGLYSNSKKGNRLVLEGPGQIGLDSIFLISNNEQEFELSTKLTVEGKYLFSIVEKDTLNNNIRRDPIPVVVSSSIPIKILILNESPTFETKYLKNYLAEIGHEVLIKTKITKNRYKYEYFNSNQKSIGKISKKSLASFDIVIMDYNSLKKLSKNALFALENSVKEDGLGIFIQPDVNLFRLKNGIGSFDFSTTKNLQTTFFNQPKIKLTQYPYTFKNEFRIHPIHRNKDSKIISAYKRLGRGRIATTVVGNTFELVLNGYANTYQEFWSTLIKNIGDRAPSAAKWESDPIITYPDHPFTFKLRTAIPKPKVKTIDGFEISLLENINLKSTWTGVTYPKNMGWNNLNLSLQQDSIVSFNYFVSDTTHWQSLYNYKRIQKNNRNFENSKSISKLAKSKQLINPITFFILFLICMGYLWIEPKISKIS